MNGQKVLGHVLIFTLGLLSVWTISYVVGRGFTKGAYTEKTHE